MQRSQNLIAAATCVERHIVPLGQRLNKGHGRSAAWSRKNKKIETELGAQMEHATTHNTFNTLFMVSFFASFLVVMLHFG
jgi:hypothetical protein